MKGNVSNSWYSYICCASLDLISKIRENKLESVNSKLHHGILVISLFFRFFKKGKVLSVEKYVLKNECYIIFLFKIECLSTMSLFFLSFVFHTLLRRLNIFARQYKLILS